MVSTGTTTGPVVGSAPIKPECSHEDDRAVSRTSSRGIPRPPRPGPPAAPTPGPPPGRGPASRLGVVLAHPPEGPQPAGEAHGHLGPVLDAPSQRGARVVVLGVEPGQPRELVTGEQARAGVLWRDEVPVRLALCGMTAGSTDGTWTVDGDGTPALARFGHLADEALTAPGRDGGRGASRG